MTQRLSLHQRKPAADWPAGALRRPGGQPDIAPLPSAAAPATPGARGFAHDFSALCSGPGAARGAPSLSTAASALQKKLSIGRTDDPLEHEADRVADAVLRMPQPRAAAKPSVAAVADAQLQSKCAACGEQDEETPQIQRRSAAADQGRTEAPAIVEDTLGAGGGQPLDIATRNYFEPRFGHDFSGVRVHAGGRAGESAQAVNALAYTVGRDIVFRDGQYTPASAAGKKLLAHELTHVVQQRGAAARGVATKPLIRRAPGLPELFPPLHLASDSVDITAGDSAAATNPALARIAAAYKAQSGASPGAYLTLTGYLNESARMSSGGEAQERSGMLTRLNAVRSALETLGVPRAAVTVEAPTQFSSTSGGKVSVSLYKDKQSYSALPGTAPNPIGPVAPPKQQQVPAAPSAAPASNSPGLAEMLSFKFNAGPVRIAAALPKSVSATLPVALSAATSLEFALQAETSGDFSFSITLNNSRHLKISAKAKLSVDKDKGTSGSAGLEIQSTRTVCSAANPEALKAKLTASAQKLQKAMQELEAAKPDERLIKAADVAGAIGEIYDTVENSKAGCKEVPVASFNFGVQIPPAPGDSGKQAPEPMNKPSPYFGLGFGLYF